MNICKFEFILCSSYFSITIASFPSFLFTSPPVFSSSLAVLFCFYINHLFIKSDSLISRFLCRSIIFLTTSNGRLPGCLYRVKISTHVYQVRCFPNTTSSANNQPVKWFASLSPGKGRLGLHLSFFVQGRPTVLVQEICRLIPLLNYHMPNPH